MADGFPSLSEAASAPKGKKQQRQKAVPLGAFLGQDSGKSTSAWADDVADDLPTGPSMSSPSYGDMPRSSGGRAESRGYGDGDRDSFRAPRPRQPIPNNPPYTAFIGNLPYQISEDELRDFFDPLKIRSVRLTKDRETGQSKGFGYVEFETREDLETVIQSGQVEFKGRNLRIDVAEPKDSFGRGGGHDGFDDRTSGDWRANRPERVERRGYEPPRREGYESRRDDRDWGRDRPQRSFAPAEPRAERRPLNLLPRTADAPAPAAANPPPAAPTKKKFDPFGGARPVDVSEQERRAEEKLKKVNEERRKAEEEERRKRHEEEVKAREQAQAETAAKHEPKADRGSWRVRDSPARRNGPGDHERPGTGRGGDHERHGAGRGGRMEGPKREEMRSPTEARPSRGDGHAWRRADAVPTPKSPKAPKPEAEGEEKVGSANKFDLLHEGDE